MGPDAQAHTALYWHGEQHRHRDGDKDRGWRTEKERNYSRRESKTAWTCMSNTE